MILTRRDFISLSSLSSLGLAFSDPGAQGAAPAAALNAPEVANRVPFPPGIPAPSFTAKSGSSSRPERNACILHPAIFS